MGRAADYGSLGSTGPAGGPAGTTSPGGGVWGWSAAFSRPKPAHPALDRARLDPAREQLLLVEDGVHAAVGRLGVLQGVHPDGVARTGLGAQAADHAAQLVDLEDLGPL